MENNNIDQQQLQTHGMQSLAEPENDIQHQMMSMQPSANVSSGGMSMPPPGMGQPLSNMGMGPPPNMSMAPPQNVNMGQQQSMGVAPPKNMGVAPPQNMGVAPPQNMGVAPPQNMGMGQPQNMGVAPPQNIGMGQPPNMNMGQPPNMNMGQQPNMNMGQAQNMNMGQPQNMNMGQPPNMNMGQPPNMNMGQPQNMNMSQPQNMNMGQPPNMNMGQPQNMNMGQPQNMNMGQPQNMNMGQPQNMNMGQSQNMNMGQPQNMNMGQPQNMNMGQPQNMNMGQSQNMGHSQNMGSTQNMGPPSLLSINTSQPGPGWMSDDHSNNDQQSSYNDQQQVSSQVPPPPTPPLMMQTSELPSLMAMKVDRPDDLVKEPKPISSDVVLPKALEDVFAFKDHLTDELGRRDGEIPVEIPEKSVPKSTTGVISTDYADADVDSDDDENVIDGNVGNSVVDGIGNNDVAREQIKLDKNKKKKRRKKQNRLERQKQQEIAQQKQQNDSNIKPTSRRQSSKQMNGKHTNGVHDLDRLDEDYAENVTIEYVPDKITIAELAPIYRQFYRVFELFKLEDKQALIKEEKLIDDKSILINKEKDKLMDEDEEDAEDDKKDDKEKLSKRKLKKLTRLSVAELKQLVHRPDVVEMHDVTARDPKLLVQLKAHRNTVQVPRHWCFKRKYLQGKRGIEKPPFDLPAFIKKTGIMEMRASLQEKDEAKTLKAKMRERARPKMGKIDIDYQKLHDAFFKWQTKPRMTIHGDLYYEGKEFETRLKEKKPGDLSEELRTALGMPIGPNCHKIPPPWLIAQQRYGPPPSYPNLKIPGLNAPIPDGTSFGYHAGGWGKPPVDEKGKPLYGDVFGTSAIDPDSGVDEGDIDRNMWGELESESEESSEEEEEDGEDLANAPDESGLVTPAEGLVTPSGLTSVPAGMETPDTIELRKKKIESEMEDYETPVLYQVLPEKRTDRIGTSMMGSTHVYDMTTAVAKQPPNITTHRAPAIGDREGMVELALDPSELDLDNEAMAQRYEQQMREQQSHLQKEDLSDMLAEHVARQKSKRKRQQGGDATSKPNKKYKEFKF